MSEPRPFVPSRSFVSSPAEEPDGRHWYVTHACAGAQRELAVVSRDGLKLGALCVWCGEWARLDVVGTAGDDGVRSSAVVDMGRS